MEQALLEAKAQLERYMEHADFAQTVKTVAVIVSAQEVLKMEEISG